MTKAVEPVLATLRGQAGNALAVDIYGDTGTPVLMLHGAGQTRYAWRRTAQTVAGLGYRAVAADQRGHGDSEWVADGAYDVMDYAADAGALARELTRQTGERPVAVGASLGGMAALIAEASHAPLFAALVLVDITPRLNRDGVAKVHGFMRAHAGEGFASVEEAADAVAAYLPHRPRPKSNEGLRRNLRLQPDGRWRWHWDPRFLDSRRPEKPGREDRERQLTEAAQRVRVPTLLVRGASSELVDEAHAREFLTLVPHATYVDVAGARHMVAGDRNDQFASAIKDFLSRFRDRS